MSRYPSGAVAYMYKLIIGMIGPGEMDAAIVNGIREAQLASEVWVAECTAAERSPLVDYAKLLPSTDVIILTAPSSQIPRVCAKLADEATLPPTVIVVSIADVPASAIQRAIGAPNPVIGTMLANRIGPLAPGISLIAGATATSMEMGIVRQIFEKLGYHVERPEERNAC
jgi:pyrroline-5-carboxylate reductase